jgi:predicted nucleic acid-binding protein
VTVFVDTSALFALLDRDADEHREAAAAFDRLLEDESLVTHNDGNRDEIAGEAPR